MQTRVFTLLLLVFGILLISGHVIATPSGNSASNSQATLFNTALASINIPDTDSAIATDAGTQTTGLKKILLNTYYYLKNKSNNFFDIFGLLKSSHADTAITANIITTCQSGQTFCGATCTDTQSDPNNCGACGILCASTQACQNGGCTSTPIYVSLAWISFSGPLAFQVPSVTPVVINTQTYPLSGILQISASGTGSISGYEFYRDGSSLIGYVPSAGDASPPGYTASSAYSFSTPGVHTYSAAVYGASGNKISTPTYSFDFEPTCSTGQTACNGVCVNTQTNSSNCGACGNICNSGQTCQNSICVTQQACGNSLVEGSEQCDGTNLAGQTCVSKGFSSGTLLCSSSCTFNTTSCINQTSQSCGNGIREGSEVCDSGANNGVACTAAYNTSCTYCTSSCTQTTLQGARCGDNLVQTANGEQCDGTNLNSKTCMTQGFTGGALSCLSSCTFNTSACTSTVADTTPPGVTPSRSPASPTTNDLVIINASASDSGGISRIDIYFNSTLVKTCYLSNTCSYSSKFSAGTYNYYASATDQNSNIGSSSQSIFTVTPSLSDTTPPTVTSYINPLSPLTTNNVTISATASDTGGINKINIYIGSSLKNTCFSTTCSYQSVFSAGNYTYYANATDNAGNTAQAAFLFTVSQPVPVNSLPIGRHDSADCNYITGWACDPDNYNTPLNVKFYEGAVGSGILIGSVTANQARTDIASSCGSNPNHGFSFATPASLRTNTNKNIYVYAVDTNIGTSQIIENSPKTVMCSSALNATPSLSLSHSPLSPTAADTVKFTATTNINSSYIQIIVDGSNKTLCYSAALCTYASNFSVGNHTYYALANSSGTPLRNPATGTKSFIASAVPTNCSDGTDIGICSSKKPKFCTSSATLKNSCSMCGCTLGYSCDQDADTCVKNLVYNKIIPGEAAIIKDFDTETGVKQIRIEVNNEVQNVKITVTKYEATPAEVSVEKSGKVYQYLQINAQNIATDLDKATVQFRVEKLWTSNNSLDKNDISVYKFDKNAERWNELQTMFSSEDSQYYYYDVEMDDFSYFAISAKSVVSGEVPAGGAGEKIINLPWFWILIFVIAIAIAIVIWKLVRKGKENFSIPNNP